MQNEKNLFGIFVVAINCQFACAFGGTNFPQIAPEIDSTFHLGYCIDLPHCSLKLVNFKLVTELGSF